MFTDLYQLTMAYAYWTEGIAETEAVFNLFFRRNPFAGGYTISCGLANVIEFLDNFKFTTTELDFLRTLKTPKGSDMFSDEFIAYLANMEFNCSIDAIPEGRVVFPNEPILRVQGPIIQAQLIESALLNAVNYQSLVATKAARVCQAAGGDQVLEFGLRRAQGKDGAISASRAAYIGGCSATSNVLAAELFGIPAAGTHAHSWVMAYDNELASFEGYANCLPDNCIFLIDTYDTLQGARNAIRVGKSLRERGKHLSGVRIDSGDLAYYSIKVRELLDEHGFSDTKIVASNDLDEYLITSLKQQHAKIDVWGVGTKLVTAFDEPALGGVYKLSAIKQEDRWKYKIKLSEQAVKINNPGIQQVKRLIRNGTFVADMIFDINSKAQPQQLMVDPLDHTRRKSIDLNLENEELLVPIFQSGVLKYQQPNIHEIRQKVQEELSKLDQSIKRLMNPHQYTVGLEKTLYDIKTQLILEMRKS